MDVRGVSEVNKSLISGVPTQGEFPSGEFNAFRGN